MKPAPQIVPVPAAELGGHYQRVVDAQRRASRRERQVGAGKNAAILLLATGLAWTVWNNGRLAEKVSDIQTVYVTLRDDGTLVNSVSYTSLPPAVTQDNKLNSLWTYVEARECYSRSEASRAFYIGQKMSDPRVRTEWVNHFSLRNPTSPQHLLGEKGAYHRCSFVSIAPLGGRQDAYQIRFTRQEVDANGRGGPVVMMVTSVAYRSGVYDPDPQAGWVDRVTFNAPGIQVWEYPGARPEGVQPVREASR